jgi:hypothetical protein
MSKVVNKIKSVFSSDKEGTGVPAVMDASDLTTTANGGVQDPHSLLPPPPVMTNESALADYQQKRRSQKHGPVEYVP